MTLRIYMDITFRLGGVLTIGASGLDVSTSFRSGSDRMSPAVFRLNRHPPFPLLLSARRALL